MEINYRIERWAQPYQPNPAMIRHILTTEGYVVYQWNDHPGAVYGNHKHDTHQTHWILTGAMELTVERVGTFVLEAGDRDFLPANVYHSVRVVSEEPVLYLIGEKG